MKCVTWSGTKPVVVYICHFFASLFLYDINADIQQYPAPTLDYKPGQHAKDLVKEGQGQKSQMESTRRYDIGPMTLQADVYPGESKVRYQSYDSISSDNSMAASLDYKYGNVVSDYSMEQSIRKGDYSKDRVVREEKVEELQRRNLSTGAAKYVNEHKEAAARLSELTQSLYHQYPDIHSVLTGDIEGKTFEEAFKGYDLGDAQEQVREMINRICDTSKSNMEVLVNAVQSIEGVDGDGNKHSDKYLKEAKIRVSGDNNDYSFLFGGNKEVSPQDIVDCYKRLKNEIIEDASSNISTEQKELQIKGLQELLAESFKSYNESYNKSGLFQGKGDNVFLNLKNINELIEEEGRDMSEIVKHCNLPEEEEVPSHHDVIRALVGENAMTFPKDLDSYMNAEKEGKRAYRNNTEALIKHAAEHPSLDMVAFLLSSASENTNSSGTKHSEAIYGHTFQTSDGYQMTIAEAMEMVQSMPDTQSRKRIISDIISSGIGGYYEKNKAMGTFENSEYGFHFSFDVNKLEQGYSHESEPVWRKINEAVKKNTKSKENSAND